MLMKGWTIPMLTPRLCCRSCAMGKVGCWWDQLVTVIKNMLKQLLRQMGYEHMSKFYSKHALREKAIRKTVLVIFLA